MQNLLDRIAELEAAIRNHRDQRGDDRCWLDDEELYKKLPEGYTPPEREVDVELENCKKFIGCRKNPATQYVSPQRRIEELEAEVQHWYDEFTRIAHQFRVAVDPDDIYKLNPEGTAKLAADYRRQIVEIENELKRINQILGDPMRCAVMESRPGISMN